MLTYRYKPRKSLTFADLKDGEYFVYGDATDPLTVRRKVSEDSFTSDDGDSFRLRNAGTLFFGKETAVRRCSADLTLEILEEDA